MELRWYRAHKAVICNKKIIQKDSSNTTALKNALVVFKINSSKVQNGPLWFMLIINVFVLILEDSKLIF